MRTIGYPALLAFCLGTPAAADGIVPEDYQGVWAAARDCRQRLQNVLPNRVDREFSACQVLQVLRSGPPESDTSTVYLNCGGSQSHEIWHGENIDGSDYLVIVRFEQRAEGAASSIDMYKRCPGIPLDEIRLNQIPGDPVADVTSDERGAPPSRPAHSARQRPIPHFQATRLRRHAPG